MRKGQRTMAEPQPLMTIDEVSQYTRIPRGTLYNWRHLGEGPPSLTLGRRVRYRREDVEAWLEQQASDNTAA